MIRLFSTRAAGVVCRALARAAGVRRPDVSWRLVTPITFDNSVAALDLDERRAHASRSGAARPRAMTAGRSSSCTGATSRREL